MKSTALAGSSTITSSEPAARASAIRAFRVTDFPEPGVPANIMCADAVQSMSRGSPRSAPGRGKLQPDGGAVQVGTELDHRSGQHLRERRRCGRDDLRGELLGVHVDVPAVLADDHCRDLSELLVMLGRHVRARQNQVEPAVTTGGDLHVPRLDGQGHGGRPAAPGQRVGHLRQRGLAEERLERGQVVAGVLVLQLRGDPVSVGGLGAARQVHRERVGLGPGGGDLGDSDLPRCDRDPLDRVDVLDLEAFTVPLEDQLLQGVVMLAGVERGRQLHADPFHAARHVHPAGR